MYGICYLLGAGFHYPNLIPAISSYDYVIAVDGGYNYAKELGITPDIVLGDFDSIESPLPDCSSSCPSSLKVIPFPPEKDYTDMMLAADEGIKAGYSTFVILGGTGGRADHTFANIQLLSWIADNGAQGYLYDKEYVYTAIKNGVLTLNTRIKPAFGQIQVRDSGYISIFSLSDTSAGVTINGLKYETNNITLNRSHALGTSNEFTGRNVTISVSCGTLLIVTAHTL